MKAKLLQGIIHDLMKMPMKHAGHGEEAHEPKVHVTVMEMGKAKPGMEDPDMDEMPAEGIDEDPMLDPMKKKLMEKAIHAKAKHKL